LPLTLTARMNAAQRTEIFARLRAANPAPTTELEYASPFQLLIAVILSAQATDKSVNLATKKLFADAPTPATMRALGEERLAEAINRIGLYRTKAKNVIATCRLLLERHDGEVPSTREALEALPGVGRKTANVVLNTAFGEATIAVDTHIFRVANRTKLAAGKTPLAVELKLLKAVPVDYRRDAHHWLILHGRYVCKARKPECWHCPIADLCGYQEKTPAPPLFCKPMAGEPHGTTIFSG
jgi:endonuclease-3